jgi:uncharacterized protein (UPF0548 family)
MASTQRIEPVYRWWRDFTPREVARELARLPERASTGPASDAETLSDPSWHHYYSEAVIAQEAEGPPHPGGAFEHARRAIVEYAFSSPDIVQGHFDPTRSLLGRPMLLELKVLGLHMLCGVTVRAVRDDPTPDVTTWGYRYDTLEGHVEAGAEWFLLSKEHGTGTVRFRIQAAWHEGTLPNWWTRAGFAVLARRYQRAWHRQAYVRLRTIVGARDLPPLPDRRAILKAWQPTMPALPSEKPRLREHET